MKTCRKAGEHRDGNMSRVPSFLYNSGLVYFILFFFLVRSEEKQDGENGDVVEKRTQKCVRTCDNDVSETLLLCAVVVIISHGNQSSAGLRHDYMQGGYIYVCVCMRTCWEPFKTNSNNARIVI